MLAVTRSERTSNAHAQASPSREGRSAIIEYSRCSFRDVQSKCDCRLSLVPSRPSPILSPVRVFNFIGFFEKMVETPLGVQPLTILRKGQALHAAYRFMGTGNSTEHRQR